jgi:hypothetical protein
VEFEIVVVGHRAGLNCRLPERIMASLPSREKGCRRMSLKTNPFGPSPAPLGCRAAELAAGVTLSPLHLDQAGADGQLAMSPANLSQSRAT